MDFYFSYRNRDYWFKFQGFDQSCVALDQPPVGPFVRLGRFQNATDLASAGLRVQGGKFHSYNSHSCFYQHLCVDLWNGYDILIRRNGRPDTIRAWEISERLSNRNPDLRYYVTDYVTCHSSYHTQLRRTNLPDPLRVASLYTSDDMFVEHVDLTRFAVDGRNDTIIYLSGDGNTVDPLAFGSAPLTDCRFSVGIGSTGAGWRNISSGHTATFTRMYNGSGEARWVLSIGSVVRFNGYYRTYAERPTTIEELMLYGNSVHQSDLSDRRRNHGPIDLFHRTPLDKTTAGKLLNHAGDVLGYLRPSTHADDIASFFRRPIEQRGSSEWMISAPGALDPALDPAVTGVRWQADDRSLIGDYHSHFDHSLLTAPVLTDSATRWGRPLPNGGVVPMFFGVELECDAVTAGEFNRVYNDGVRGARMVFQYDGSLSRSRGFEAITRPYGYEDQLAIWERTPPEWNGLCDSTSDCGMHVHVTRAAISPPALIRLYRLMSVMPPDVIKAVAGRYESSYASISGLKQVKRRLLAMGYNPGVGRYMAVNATTNTIEFRLFAGTIRKDAILARLQFVHAILIYTRNCSLAASGSPWDFINSTSRHGAYPELEMVLRPFSAGATAQSAAA